jgi:hypothetical protein
MKNAYILFIQILVDLEKQHGLPLKKMTVFSVEYYLIVYVNMAFLNQNYTDPQIPGR